MISILSNWKFIDTDWYPVIPCLPRLQMVDIRWVVLDLVLVIYVSVGDAILQINQKRFLICAKGLGGGLLTNRFGAYQWDTQCCSATI